MPARPAGDARSPARAACPGSASGGSSRLRGRCASHGATPAPLLRCPRRAPRAAPSRPSVRPRRVPAPPLRGCLTSAGSREMRSGSRRLAAFTEPSPPGEHRDAPLTEGLLPGAARCLAEPSRALPPAAAAGPLPPAEYAVSRWTGSSRELLLPLSSSRLLLLLLRPRSPGSDTPGSDTPAATAPPPPVGPGRGPAGRGQVAAEGPAQCPRPAPQQLRPQVRSLGSSVLPALSPPQCRRLRPRSSRTGSCAAARLSAQHRLHRRPHDSTDSIQHHLHSIPGSNTWQQPSAPRQPRQHPHHHPHGSSWKPHNGLVITL